MKLKKFIILTKVLFVVAFGIIIRHVHASFVNNQRIVVTADSILHESISATISDYLVEHDLFKKSSLAALTDDIKKQSPAIAHVTSERCPPHTIHVHLHACKPMISINDTVVLATNQTYVPQKLFVSCVIKECTAITYHEEIKALTDFSPALTTGSHQLRIDALKNYTIDWHNDHYTRLHNAHTPQFSIICSADSLPTNELIKQCEQIEQKITMQSARTKKKQHWVADIRFRDQIVVYNEEKGATYG
jgi:hypothetical protein